MKSLPEITWDGFYGILVNPDVNTIIPVSVCPVCKYICSDLKNHLLQSEDELHIIYMIHAS